MCGIAGFHVRSNSPLRNANRLADHLLLAIAHRGSDATGLLAQTATGERTLMKATEPCARFVLNRKAFSRDARTVLLHTRFATRGAADDPRNAHPVIAGPVAAIHNGTIYNDRELFDRFGMKRTADVDSIVIPALIRHFGWDNARKALGKLTGGAATAVISAEHPGELILARVTTYPMHVLVNDDVIVWASERTAISMAWSKTYGSPPKGEWVTLGEHEIMHVNGSITFDRLPRPKLAKRATGKVTAPWPPSRTVQGKTTARKPKRAKAPRQKPLPLTQAVEQDNRGEEQLIAREVADLMAWAGCSYEDAYEEVTGRSAPLGDGAHLTDEEWSWIDDVLREQQS